MKVDRAKVLSVIATGEKALKAYDGASSAWEGFKAAGTASHHFSGLAETLVGADGLLGDRLGNHSRGTSAAAWLLFATIAGAISAPRFIKKG